MKVSSVLGFALCLTAATAFQLNAALGDYLPSGRIMYGAKGKNVVHKPKSRRVRGAIGSCKSTPTTRNCWLPGYTVADDFDTKWPTTGVTRYYTLTLTNTTCNPDGANTRHCYLINDQFPGPILRANWGDWFQITVINNLQYNGTSMHFHGIRQLNTYTMDGVNGITQCPLAPGATQVYRFQATQFGTSWYHSHHSAQYGDGVAGPIIVDGPTSANWDIDLGPVSVQDWYYKDSYLINMEALMNQQQGHAPPTANNLLINGTNMNPGETTGKYMGFTLTPGKKHLLRLINMASDNTIRVSLDGHTMQIVTADFVPIAPITVQSVLVGIGQRYEVIVTANQTPGNYWFRAESEFLGCYSANQGSGRGIATYQGVAAGRPTTSASYTNGGNCLEPSPLTPWVQNQVGDEAEFIEQVTRLPMSFTRSQLTTNNQSIVVWGLNFNAIRVDWEYPVLSYLKNGQQDQIPASESVIEIAAAGEWVFWIVQEVQPSFFMPHPMHLHGHDFYVLGQGIGTFDINSDPAKLTYFNPPRRDTVILQAGGWVVMAFPVDNPGTWVMHCHVATHVSQGLGVQFIESAEKMVLPGADYDNQCSSWKSYAATALFGQDLSGL